MNAASFLTPRLSLRPLGPEYARELHTLLAEPGVRRFLCDDEILDRAITDGFAERSAALHEVAGYGLWAATSRSAAGVAGTLAGITGLWSFREPPELELLYAFTEACWGQGFAHEAASCVIAYAIDGLGMEVVRASTDTPNRGSIRVLEKLGMTIVDRRTVDGKDTTFAQASSADWQRPSWWNQAQLQRPR